MLQRVPLGAERLERALAEVYARPEFAPATPSRLSEWLAAARRAVWRFFVSLFEGSLPESGGRVLAWAVVALLVVAALFVAVRLVLGARGLWRGRERSRPGREPATAAEKSEGALGWEEQARRLAAAGRWREAALALYPALLLRLAERGALRYDSAKTPGDYRRETRSDEPAHRALSAFLRGFEPVAFGAREVDGPLYERLRAAAGEGGTRA